VQGQRLGRAGAKFFSMGATDAAGSGDWTRLRDRWEYSHVARAGFATASCIGLALAFALD
jgi:hypothetical protein